MTRSTVAGRGASLTPEERRSQLAKASRDYMAGKIDHDTFRKTERMYMTDYDSAFYELSRFSPWVRRTVQRMFRSAES